MRVNPATLRMQENIFEQRKSNAHADLEPDVFDAVIAHASGLRGQDAGRQVKHVCRAGPEPAGEDRTCPPAEANGGGRIDALIEFYPSAFPPNGSIAPLSRGMDATPHAIASTVTAEDPLRRRIAGALPGGRMVAERTGEGPEGGQEGASANIIAESRHRLPAPRGGSEPNAAPPFSGAGHARIEGGNARSTSQAPIPASDQPGASAPGASQPASDATRQLPASLIDIASNELGETSSTRLSNSQTADAVEQTVRSALISAHTDQLDNMCLVLRTEGAGDVEVRIAVADDRASIEIAAAPEAAQFIENERTMLEARLQQATGVGVDVSVVPHQQNAPNHRQEMTHHEFSGMFHSSIEGRSDGERRSDERERRDASGSQAHGKSSHMDHAHPDHASSGARRDLLL
ncbi:MAG TPA: flagellar hook-length control protein FliK [Rhodoblastus sp.]|nr:flagellar hook-length control protein FliK [Rhodoblastus sp.]